MNCKYNCTCIAVIVGIIVGVILGVLYSLGFVSTGIIFWAYLAIGVAGILLAPIYALQAAQKGHAGCFCRLRGLFTAAAVGAVIASVVGFIVVGFATVPVIAIVIGVATFFAVAELALLICLAKCSCSN